MFTYIYVLAKNQLWTLIQRYAASARLFFAEFEWRQICVVPRYAHRKGPWTSAMLHSAGQNYIALDKLVKLSNHVVWLKE
jgi:hypothetical protein